MVHIRFAEFDRCAGDLRVSNLLRILSAHNKVTLHILYKPADVVDAPQNRQYLDLMTRLGIDVTTGSIRARLREERYDVVLIEFWYVARYLFDEIRAIQPDARVIVDTEHIYFRSKFLGAMTRGEDPRAPALLDEKNAELDSYARADLVVTTTDEDKTLLLNENPGLAIATIPTIHEIPKLDVCADTYRKPGSLVFVGNFANNPANVDGIMQFCAETLPLVRRRLPTASLTIVGNRPPAAVQELACDHVAVTGFVPAIEPYLAATMVSICPIRFGAGLKGKITEAMMHGLPVVTTSIGTQGMNARHGEDIMVGDTPEQFADCIVRLLEQPALRETLSRNGRDLCIRNYSFEAVAARVNQIMSAVGVIPVKRYGATKRMALKVRFELADLLHRHVLWRVRGST